MDWQYYWLKQVQESRRAIDAYDKLIAMCLEHKKSCETGLAYAEKELELAKDGDEKYLERKAALHARR